ncbi:MAG: N-acetylornithine carbamoyltransferase [Lewinellaceae bacterium]|nr:N-acetylornithine carbamoyltransferase [Lewinella sp.]MCB9282007.1 N-acetylornithine carbamoyltransferase [Lewinellaceae bacterium]
MKNFTAVSDVSDVKALVKRALEIKQEGPGSTIGQHKTLVLLFFNPSLRTRLSTEKAGRNLGMQVITMNAGEGWKLEFEEGAVMNGDSAEHVKEAAGVISRYADIIGVRSFPAFQNREEDYSEKVLRQFMRYASVPVVNLESATLHPLQSLTDLITIEEYKTTARPKVVLSWAPHPRILPQAVANSFVEWMKVSDVELVVTHPEGYELAPPFAEGVRVEYDQAKAFEGADFVYAKNWSPYYRYGEILSQDPEWTISARQMSRTNNAKFMHCLPVRRNVVVEDSVLDHPDSIILQQAGNREVAAQAVLERLLLEAATPRRGGC